MAYTRKEYIDLLKEIGMSGPATPRMLELLQKLRDDFDEREGMLKSYGERRDKETPDGFEQEERKIRRESRRDDEIDGGERRDAYGVRFSRRSDEESDDRKGVDEETVSKAAYDELKKAYIDRFFSTPEEAIKAQEEDVKKDDKVRDLDFDELFKDREGI